VFGKTCFQNLFAFGLGVITPYSLGVLIWNFYQTFLIVCIHLWLRFEPQIRSTRFVINFLLIIATTERNVLFRVKLFDHFLTERLSVWAEICRVLFEILLVFIHMISKRNYFSKMFEKLHALQGAHLSILAKFCPTFCNFILSSYYTEKFKKSYTSTFICCLYPVKEAHPKRKHSKRNKEENQGRSVFGKTSFPVLFCSCRLTEKVFVRSSNLRIMTPSSSTQISALRHREHPKWSEQRAPSRPFAL